MKRAFRRSSRPRWMRDLLQVAVGIVCMFAVRSALADHYRVPSGSMEPTIFTGDHIVANKLAYGLRVPFTQCCALACTEPERGEVVVLVSPDDLDVVLLKRVVARGGDAVEVRDGIVWLDGKRTNEAYVKHPGGRDLQNVRVPEGMLLVLGDNRENSHDGRDFGFVRANAVLGRVERVVARNGELSWSAVQKSPRR